MFSGGRGRVQWEQILDMDDIDATNVLTEHNTATGKKLSYLNVLLRF